MTEKKGMKALELWCRRVTEGYPGVKIENMTTSWRDGLAFCALIHHFRPDLIDFDNLDKRDIYKNNELAFRIAERQLGIPALLDAEDMVEYEVPDRLSILTYLSQFYQAFVSNQQGATNSPARTHSSKVSEISPTKTTKSSKVSSGRLETCWTCRRPVFLAERLVIGGKPRHRTCFTCKRCGNQLNLVGCYETETGDFVCETCPDEEKRRQEENKEKQMGLIGEERNVDITTPPRSERPKIEIPMFQESSLDLEKRLDSFGSTMKRKFLDDLLNKTSSSFDAEAHKRLNESPSENGKEILISSINGLNNDQQCTANRDNLNVNNKSLLGKHFSEIVSLLNHEHENLIADVSDIIDSIISDAVKETENITVKKSCGRAGFIQMNISDDAKEKKEAEEYEEFKEKSQAMVEGENKNSRVVHVEADRTTVAEDHSGEETKTENECENSHTTAKETAEKRAEEKAGPTIDDYPEDLNPFAEEDEDNGLKQNTEEMPRQPTKPDVSPRKAPIPAARNKTLRETGSSRPGQKVIEAPLVNLNPFWSDGEPSSDDDSFTKPTPVPRNLTKASEEEESPFSHSQYGSFNSLHSAGSAACKKKKGLAPQPPQNVQIPLPSPSQNDSQVRRSPSPTASLKSHRKTKPAPPPPLTNSTLYLPSCGREISPDKKEKNYENKLKQNLSVPDKSSYGKWKRKKGLAPALPIPQRRRITPLPLEEFYRELEDLEIQQRELERQGVNIEQTIRMYEVESADDAGGGDSSVGKDVEDLVLQLFDIVNQKNELFRRQAELMYLRRQQRLEEEHADLEYQIRCLMGRSERNKTDSDKAQEEELIRRLVEVVERRNEIIECLDMDRKREVEEDESIHHHLEVFAGKKNSFSSKVKYRVKSSPSHLLKFVKKKKSSKKEKKEKLRRDADKDVDEEDDGKAEDWDKRHQQSSFKSSKSKKKWFTKMNI